MNPKTLYFGSVMEEDGIYRGNEISKVQNSNLGIRFWVNIDGKKKEEFQCQDQDFLPLF